MNTKIDTLLPGVQVLHPDTKIRVHEANEAYNAGMDEITAAKAASNTHTPVKDEKVNVTRIVAKSFIVVFDSGVDRGKYIHQHRAYFGLNVNNSNLPDLRREDAVKTLAENIISGDLLRVAAGGAAMSNPDTAEVGTKLTDMNTERAVQSTLKDTLDTKQENISNVKHEAKKVVTRAWNEVETYFSEETPESKRANAREYGVVYVSKGPGAMVTGLVKNTQGNPLAGAVVEIIETGATGVTNTEGRYTVSTIVIGSINLEVTFPGLATKTVVAEIPEHEQAITVNVADITM